MIRQLLQLIRSSQQLPPSMEQRWIRYDDQCSKYKSQRFTVCARCRLISFIVGQMDQKPQSQNPDQRPKLNSILCITLQSVETFTEHQVFKRNCFQRNNLYNFIMTMNFLSFAYIVRGTKMNQNACYIYNDGKNINERWKNIMYR